MSVLWRETKDVMVSQLNGNIKQTTTTTTIQNPTSIHNPITILRPTQNHLPGIQTLSRLPSEQGFCSPANHPYTWIQLPVVTTDRKQACKSHGAGPGPAR